MRHKAMTPNVITALRAINWSAVARLAGVSQSAISRTLHGHRRSPHIRRIICAAARLREQEIWPDTKPHTTRAA